MSRVPFRVGHLLQKNGWWYNNIFLRLCQFTPNQQFFPLFSVYQSDFGSWGFWPHWFQIWHLTMNTRHFYQDFVTLTKVIKFNIKVNIYEYVWGGKELVRYLFSFYHISITLPSPIILKFSPTFSLLQIISLSQKRNSVSDVIIPNP